MKPAICDESIGAGDDRFCELQRRAPGSCKLSGSRINGFRPCSGGGDEKPVGRLQQISLRREVVSAGIHVTDVIVPPHDVAVFGHGCAQIDVIMRKISAPKYATPCG